MTKVAHNLTAQAGSGRRLPAHEVIYRQLRALVLFGDLAPGQAVTIQGLTDRLGAGMTPVREAIRRLTAEGALEFQGNRRVCVPLLSAANVSELILARQWLDPHLALRATERAAPADLDHLERLDTELDAAITRGDLRGYLESNYRFHKELYDLAEAPILSDMADGLWLRFGPSLRVVCGRMGTQNLPDKHKELLAAMHARDAEGAARAIREDVIQGMEQVRQSLDDPGG
ncbi:GntR family transcriptional regulator [Roseovarius sp. A21]|uniref:GntR family transcriptional regulator n=1 Tax=Roseovarius bejariae TaxID=2576383 RepID=A0A844CQH7_9RHOB|nr:GntR family transcriptional regulator [Roseovarius bejariae]MRU15725.1 GntR family transcriptional regulator [Roseovarius bejariae]